MADLPFASGAFLAAAGLAVTGTWLVRRHAIASQLLDIPNSRSSHTTPVPRGGGLAVVVAIAVVIAAWYLDAGIRGLAHWLPLAGLLAVAAIGWADDRAHAPVALRLAVHVAAALTLVPLAASLGSLHAWIGGFAAVIWIFGAVSAINIVNFMDGIDGLIASQILIFGVHGALAAPAAPSGVAAQALAGAAAGFLIWNWAPARIFMGDVGSGALGFAAVWAGALVVQQGPAGLVAAFLPLYPLSLDATATLVRRLVRGEKITEAHRTHLYQRLANGSWGHARVTMLYGLAALAGVAVARVDHYAASPAIVGTYAIVVLLAGLWLHRTVGILVPPASRMESPRSVSR